MMLPFALLLAAMALGPLIAARQWHRHYATIALGLGALAAAYFILVLHRGAFAAEIAENYLSFIALIGSLFVVSGGIHFQVRGASTPAGNVLYLFIGALLANVLGTTGAAMLLIRPWLTMNRSRLRAFHLVFFMFIVANVGGTLTPVGNPPLFLGYLEGVPFWWITLKAWPMWATAMALLLALFFLLDRRNFSRAVPAPHVETGPPAPRCTGLINLLYLAIILGALLLRHPLFLREGLMVLAAAASYYTTPRAVHAANEFNLHPVREVAVLFAGVFATMMPVLDWVQTHATVLLGADPRPGWLYWMSGGLSSVLDNAPTYLTFLRGLGAAAGTSDTPALLAQHPGEILALSIGAVFFGAATYIGNAPNYMIKAVAEQRGAPTPTFLGLIAKFTVPFLLPVLVVIWMLFFNR